MEVTDFIRPKPKQKVKKPKITIPVEPIPDPKVDFDLYEWAERHKKNKKKQNKQVVKEISSESDLGCVISFHAEKELIDMLSDSSCDNQSKHLNDHYW